MMNRLKFPLLAAGIFVASLASEARAQGALGDGGASRAAAELREDAASREAGRKQELIAAVLSARETASGRKFSPDLRGSLARKLFAVPVEALEAFSTAGGLGNIDGLVRDTVGPKTLGSSAADLTFTPVTPCRIINTTVSGGALAANTTRSFFVNGSTAGTFEGQGGTAGGCGIPDTATAVMMNFVAVGPAGPGDLRAFPWAASPTVPNASVINYANVSGLNIANGLVQPVCNAATTTCTFDLIVQADVASSHVVVDVLGYFNKVDTTAVKSFTVNSVRTFISGAVSATCSNAGGAQVTVVAPVAGQVVVNGSALFSISHTTGGSTQVNAFIGTAANSCPGAYGADTSLILPAAFPTVTGWFYHEYPIKTFTVAQGSTTTFFLTSQQFSGPAGQSIQHSSITATFIPD